MNDSSWRQFLTRQGAHWDERGLSHFGDKIFPLVEEESEPTNSHPAVIVLSHWAALRIAGANARMFLQGQVTCDMAAVSSKQWQRGANCNVKGRAVFTFYCTQEAHVETDSFLLFIPRSTVELAQENLKKYAVFSKVTIDLISDYHLLGFIGGEDQVRDYFADGQTVSHHAQTVALKLPGGRCLFMVQQDRVEDWWQKFIKPGEPQGYPVWDLAGIRAGYGDVEAATSGEFIPQFLNFHVTGGISFIKGCYLGQEVVARMAYRGTLKRHMRRAQVSGGELPALNAPLYGREGEQSIGNIVSAVQTDSDSIELLAVVTDAAFDDNEVYLDRQKIHKLRFLALPYAITN